MLGKELFPIQSGYLCRKSENFQGGTAGDNPAEKVKKIAVVGGGPAGMEFARVAKLRGHEVTLYEKDRLGGALNEAAVPEFKADIRPLTKAS